MNAIAGRKREEGGRGSERTAVAGRPCPPVPGTHPSQPVQVAGASSCREIRKHGKHVETQRNTISKMNFSAPLRLVCSKHIQFVLLLLVVPVGRRAQREVTQARRPAHDRLRLVLKRPPQSLVQAGLVSLRPNSRLSSPGLAAARDARIRKKGPS